jgi:hypothetical protein
LIEHRHRNASAGHDTTKMPVEEHIIIEYAPADEPSIHRRITADPEASG